MRTSRCRPGAVALLVTCHATGPVALASQDAAGLGVLEAEGITLGRTGLVGDSTTYAISRENLTLGPEGAVIATILASGTLVRTLAEEVEDGVWSESFAWREYRYGQLPPGSTAEPQSVAGVEGLTYLIDPRDPMPTWWGVAPDSPIEGPAAALFSVLLLDAWSWDAIVHGVRRESGGPVRAGEGFSLEEWSEGRDIGAGPAGLAGRYRLGTVDVTVVGVSACGASERCLRLGFRTGANEVEQQLPGMSVAGREYFEGTADLSLANGALVSGELWGPLIATFTVNDSPAPIAAVLQRVRIARR